MSDPSEAFEWQIKAGRALSDFANRAEQRAKTRKRHGIEGDQIEDDMVQSAVVGALITDKAETFALSHGIANVIGEAGRQLDDSYIFYGEVPADSGFVWCDAPLPIIQNSDLGVLQGFCWELVGPHGMKPSGANILFIYRQTDEYAARMPVRPEFVNLLPLNAGLQEMMPLNGRRRITDQLIERHKFVAAFWLFVQQRIVVTRAEPVSRHVQRRNRKHEHSAEPVLRIVELRAREYQYTERTDDPQHRDYSCQWIVRGHWRNQWYPSQGRHQPKWITPYVKGPENAPLKAPRANVFAVVR